VNPPGPTGDQRSQSQWLGDSAMFKILLMVLVLIAVTLVAGTYFRFNPAIPIFVILGIGIFLVGRIGGPQLPPGQPRHLGRRFRCLCERP
jgi:hypothetical protein